MGQFKPMVKMETTEPSVELKLKKGGSVKKAMGGMMGAPMDATMASSMPARGGMMPVARPKKPSMAMRRASMAGATMKEGGMSDTAQDKAMIKKAFKQHDMQEHKGGKGTDLKLKKGGMKKGGMATGGVVNGQGGYATGGVVNGNGGGYKHGGMAMVKKNGKMVPDFVADGKGKMKKGGKAMMGGGAMHMMPDGTMMDNTVMKKGGKAMATGGVALGNAGGYKKGGASKKHYATGGTVNSGKPVAMPQGDKKPSAPVSTNRISGTFKTGGSVTPAQKKEQSAYKGENATAMKQAKAQSNEKYQSGGGVTDASKGAYDKSIGPSEEDMDMAKTIRSIPSKLYEGAKSLFTNKDKPSGSVTKTEKSVTVTPARKRGGAVNC